MPPESIQLTPEGAEELVAAQKQEQKPAQTAQETKPNAEVQTKDENADQPQRPEWCPEKFWKDGKVDNEGLAKSYAELEKSKSPKDKTDPAKDSKEKTDEKADENPQDDPKTEAAFQPFFEEFDQTGELSEDSFKALEAKGLSRPVVESYIRGQQALAEDATRRTFEAAGGEDSYRQLVQWAGQNLNPTEQKAFNDTLATGDVPKIILATQGLKARHAEATGSSGKRIRGSGSGAAVAPFRSSDEVTAAMSDPRYASDSSFREDVAARLAVSDVL